MHHVTTVQQLESLFARPGQAALRKEVDRLHPVYRRWIEHSPFALLATHGPEGLDVSPRGDPAPLVRVVDEHMLLLPERRGNNRIDTLRNLLHDPRISLIFLIPGVGETLRVVGTARIVCDAALMQSFAVRGAAPVCALQVDVQKVFFQCARATLRSGLWAAPAERPAGVPTAGQMLAEVSQGQVGGARYDEELPQRQRTSLY